MTKDFGKFILEIKLTNVMNRAIKNIAKVNLRAVKFVNGRRTVVNVPVEILPLNTIILGITLIISIILSIIILG